MEKLFDQIVLCKEHFQDENFYEVLGRQIYTLLKSEEIVTIYDDDTDIIVIQHAHNEKVDAWGVANPMWVTPEEEEQILYDRENNEDFIEDNDDSCNDEDEDYEEEFCECSCHCCICCERNRSKVSE